MAKTPVTLEKMESSPESHWHALTLRDAIHEGDDIREHPIIKGWLRDDEATVAGLPIYLGAGRSIAPKRRTLPGTTALWVQLEGEATLRAGGTRQRTKFVGTSPGDVVAIIGTGKRSFDNFASNYSLGLLVEIVPLEVVRGEIEAQQAAQALNLMADSDPTKTAAAGILLEQLDRGLVSPGVAYEIAHRHSQPQEQ